MVLSYHCSPPSILIPPEQIGLQTGPQPGTRSRSIGTPRGCLPTLPSSSRRTWPPNLVSLVHLNSRPTIEIIPTARPLLHGLENLLPDIVKRFVSAPLRLYGRTGWNLQGECDRNGSSGSALPVGLTWRPFRRSFCPAWMRFMPMRWKGPISLSDGMQSGMQQAI